MEVVGVISRMKHYEIISLHRKGTSFRQIARELDVDRKTVAKICHRYDDSIRLLPQTSTPEEYDDVVSQIVEHKKYDGSTRKKRVYSKEIDQRMKELYHGEKVKDIKLGLSHKQALTAKAVHEILISEGYEISYRSVALYWGKIKEKTKEAYIRQSYELGERLEFDFGEVKLEINGTVKIFYLAVLAAPASGFYWAYLYNNQKKAVFLDAHVQFFEMVQGVYEEVVYDNMRNVVSRFIGRNEKELNGELIKLSLYYNFDINVTNCFSGNEKGTVEGRVKHVRRECFSKKYEFNSIEHAREHLQKELLRINEKSAIQEEVQHLSPYKLPFELAEIRTSQVNKYSCIQVDNNYYSVPDYLVGKKLQIKEYHDYFIVYSNQSFVCQHKKIEGSKEYCLNISHYFKTFRKKPGAIGRSLVLKQNPELYTLYHKHYKENPKDFIDILEEYENENLSTLIYSLSTKAKPKQLKNQIVLSTESDLHRLNMLYGLEVK